jgi:hypothetical protein
MDDMDVTTSKSENTDNNAKGNVDSDVIMSMRNDGDRTNRNNSTSYGTNEVIDQHQKRQTITTIVQRIEDDDNPDNEVVERDMDHTTTILPKDGIRLPSKRMYLLSLVQMYQNVYMTYTVKLYKSMIWNLTVSCRAIQSRSTSCQNLTSNTLSAISAVHIPIHRELIAQRRIYSTPRTTCNDNNTIKSNAMSSSMPRMYECDEYGIPNVTTSVDQRTTPQRNGDTTLMDDENVPSLYDDIGPSTTTGLRQRKGQQQQKPSQRTPANIISNSISIEERNNEDLDQNQQHQKTKNDQHMIQLLLRSSSNGLLSKAPVSLLDAQKDSIQLLQYISTILIQIQQLILHEIQQQ